MKRIVLLVPFLVIVCLTLSDALAAADDWLELDDFGPVTQRVEVTVENPADVPVEAAVVRLAMQDLRKVLPGARADRICVVDPTTKAPRRELADQNFVPFQVRQMTLTFSLPLDAMQSKKVHIYSAPQALNMPGFPVGTAYDSRHAYRSFENRYAAFRLETGPGANTTGLTIDAFGKTRRGIGVRLQEIYGGDSYHELQDWGVDILKVGSGPGIGGAYVFAGDEWARPVAATSFVEQIYTGPVETKIRATAPVNIAGRDVTLTRTLTLIADDRTIHDELVLEGGDLDGLQLGVGVRDLPNCVWVEKPEQGYAFQTGDANQPNYKAVGLGITFNPEQYDRTYELTDPANGGHVYIMKSEPIDGRIAVRQRLATIWDMDGQLERNVDSAEDLRAPFQSWFERWSAQSRAPVTMTLGGRAETRSR